MKNEKELKIGTAVLVRPMAFTDRSPVKHPQTRSKSSVLRSYRLSSILVPKQLMKEVAQHGWGEMFPEPSNSTDSFLFHSSNIHKAHGFMQNWAGWVLRIQNRGSPALQLTRA